LKLPGCRGKYIPFGTVAKLILKLAKVGLLCRFLGKVLKILFLQSKILNGPMMEISRLLLKIIRLSGDWVRDSKLVLQSKMELGVYGIETDLGKLTMVGPVKALKHMATNLFIWPVQH
jgi:hypothetical protein